MSNLFRKEYNEYGRDLDYVRQWVEQSTTYAKIQDPNLNVEPISVRMGNFLFLILA